jgi:hypothetical protein
MIQRKGRDVGEVRAKDEFRALDEAAINDDLGPGAAFVIGDALDDPNRGTLIAQEVARLAHGYMDALEKAILQYEPDIKPDLPATTCPIEDIAFQAAIMLSIGRGLEVQEELNRIVSRIGQ